MKKIVIAIDGYSSTGKSTIAKELAKTLHYIYVDTGAMYRAVTKYALDEGFIGKGFLREDQIIDALDEVELAFRKDDDKVKMYLNGKNVEEEIRGIGVSNYVSQIAAIPEVREFLVRQQQKMGEKKGVVMDGRDIGTVVFPEAELKLFMTSSAAVRAKRRHKEMREKGQAVSYEEVLKNITERDALDTTRKTSPLIKAEDAIEIDNSKLTREEQFTKILELVEKRIASVQEE